MSETLLIPIRLVNGVVTMAFFPFLFKIFQRTKRRFYLLWGIGFLLYGINIIIRAALPPLGLESSVGAQLFSFLFLLSGFTSIITGIGDLVDKAKTLLISTMILPLLTAILYFTTRPEEIGWVISLSPYLFVSISLLIIRRRYSAALDLFVVGWMILLFVNVSVPLKLMNATFVEFMAIFGKAVILVGMTYPRFSFIVDDLKKFLISGIPTIYPNKNLDSLTLINPTSGHRNKEIQWIKDKIEENSLKAIGTILITTYDLISPLDLKASGIRESDFYLVRMLPGGRGPTHVFDEHIMTINDDLNELDFLFSDIINYSDERRIISEIIIYTLSSLIHTHGWKRVYSFLLSKMPQLKASSVHAYILYYPETHTNRADIVKFEKLADRILTI